MFSIKCFALIAVFSIVNAKEIQFFNNLVDEIRVGCEGNAGHEHLKNGGWKLGPGQRMSIEAPDNWAGHFWGRTWCNTDSNHCEMGNCDNKVECKGTKATPAMTVAEFKFKDNRNLDYYQISLQDGFNVEMSIEPLRGNSDGAESSCKRAACLHHILPECPSELQLIGTNGNIIGCNSACNAFRSDEYCCTGANNNPDNCKPTNWPVDYSKFFKERCPDAKTHAYDNERSTFTCDASTYLVTFGDSSMSYV